MLGRRCLPGRPMPRYALIAVLVVAAAWGAWRLSGAGEAAPECPGTSPYCDRAAYIAGAGATCAATTSARDTRLIENTTTLDAYCGCISARMFDAFDTAALWRLDTGRQTGPERTLLDAQAGTWATACLGL